MTPKEFVSKISDHEFSSNAFVSGVTWGRIYELMEDYANELLDKQQTELIEEFIAKLEDIKANLNTP